MNYISLLSEDDLVTICELITGKSFKSIFQKHSKEFAKIKKGFRPTSLKDSEAVKLAANNTNEAFISEYICETIQEWMQEIENKLMTII